MISSGSSQGWEDWYTWENRVKQGKSKSGAKPVLSSAVATVFTSLRKVKVFADFNMKLQKSEGLRSEVAEKRRIFADCEAKSRLRKTISKSGSPLKTCGSPLKTCGKAYEARETVETVGTVLKIYYIYP